MKNKLLLATLMLAYSLTSFTQVSVSPEGQDPHPAAILDLISNDKGFLFPRMTTEQRDEIDPEEDIGHGDAEFLIIANTETKCIEIYVDGYWQELWCSDSEDPCPVPGAPNANAATNVLDDEFTANWDAVTSDPAVTHYLLDVSTDSDFDPGDIYDEENVGTVTEYQVEGLDPETTYYFRVFAVNECGASDPSNVESVETDDIDLGACEGVTPPGGFGVVSSAGYCWLDRNLGASQVCENSTDEDCYGDLFQWGRSADGHESRDSDEYSDGLATHYHPGFGSDWDGEFIINDSHPHDWLEDSNDELWQVKNFINNPCPDGFRIPAEEELSNERSSWDSDDAAGAFGSPLKFPLSGQRDRNGVLGNVGEHGRYWSNDTGSGYARGLHFTSSNNSGTIHYEYKATGYAVRCIKDEGYCCNGLCLGDEHEGGIIAYFFEDGDNGYVEGECHGIIIATNDQSTSYQWGCAGIEVGAGAQGQEIGDGMSNTNAIVSFHDDGSNFSCDNYYDDEAAGSTDCGCFSASDGTVAAKLCYDLDDGGYNDWFLPSRNEWTALIGAHNRGESSLPGSGSYWTSSEHPNPTYSHTDAFFGSPGWAPPGTIEKRFSYRVRCIRTF